MAVPEGTIDEVMDWVGDDPDRANEAYEAEAAGKGRATLLSRLSHVVAAANEAEAQVDEPEPEPEPEPKPAGDVEVFVAAKRLRYKGEWYEPGQPLPDAHTWPRVESWIRQGYVRRQS